MSPLQEILWWLLIHLQMAKKLVNSLVQIQCELEKENNQTIIQLQQLTLGLGEQATIRRQRTLPISMLRHRRHARPIHQ
jgi:hypothetical protein